MKQVPKYFDDHENPTIEQISESVRYPHYSEDNRAHKRSLSEGPKENKKGPLDMFTFGPKQSLK